MSTNYPKNTEPVKLPKRELRRSEEDSQRSGHLLLGLLLCGSLMAGATWVLFNWNGSSF